MKKAATPWLQQPRVQRIVYPGLVALVLIAAWQGAVTGMHLPPYLARLAHRALGAWHASESTRD